MPKSAFSTRSVVGGAVVEEAGGPVRSSLSAVSARKTCTSARPKRAGGQLSIEAALGKRGKS